MPTGPECYEQNADNSLYIKDGKILFNSTSAWNCGIPLCVGFSGIGGYHYNWWMAMSENCCWQTYFTVGDPYYATDKWDCGWDYDEGIPECCP